MEMSRFVRTDRSPLVQKVNTFFAVGDGIPGFMLVGFSAVISIVVGLSSIGATALWWLFVAAGVLAAVGVLKYLTISQGDIGDSYMEKAYPVLRRITDPERRAIANQLFDEIYDCAEGSGLHYSCGSYWAHDGSCDERMKMLRKLADPPKAAKALERAKDLLAKEEQDREMYREIMKELGESA